MVMGVVLVVAALGGGTCTTEHRATYQGGKVTVTACPVTPSYVDEPLAQSCAGGCFLGLTVRMADGRQIDVAPKDVRGAELDKPVVIQGEVGPGALEYQVALWLTKRGPCKVEAGKQLRHGCKAYGYEMHDAVWGISFDATEQLMPFTPLPGREPNRVEILDAGAGPKAVGMAKAALGSLAIQTLPPAIKTGTAQGKRDFVEVLYRAKWHRVIALRMIEQLQKAGVGIRWRATHWPEATSAFVIAVGAPGT